MDALGRLPRDRLRDLLVGLRSWPDRRGWSEAGVWSLLFVAVAGPLAWAAGLLGPAVHGGLGVGTLLTPFVAPAFIEECVFRGLLMPHPTASDVPQAWRARWWATSLTLYVVAHPIAALLFRPGARGVFDAPAFLIEAGLLGITTTALYQRTGSLWPGILLHGAVVAVWLGLGGRALLGG